MPVQEVLKSVNTWQRYGQQFSGGHAFMTHGLHHHYM